MRIITFKWITVKQRILGHLTLVGTTNIGPTWSQGSSFLQHLEAEAVQLPRPLQDKKTLPKSFALGGSWHPQTQKKNQTSYLRWDSVTPHHACVWGHVSLPLRVESSGFWSSPFLPTTSFVWWVLKLPLGGSLITLATCCNPSQCFQKSLNVHYIS